MISSNSDNNQIKEKHQRNNISGAFLFTILPINYLRLSWPLSPCFGMMMLVCKMSGWRMTVHMWRTPVMYWWWRYCMYMMWAWQMMWMTGNRNSPELHRSVKMNYVTSVFNWNDSILPSIIIEISAVWHTLHIDYRIIHVCVLIGYQSESSVNCSTDRNLCIRCTWSKQHSC